MQIVVPIAVACLKEEGARGGREAQALHEHSLGWLLRLAAGHPQPLKQLLARNARLRTRVQAALQTGGVAAGVNTSSSHPSLPLHHQPSIQLKTDFSNFAAE
jgi:hypothetical protein